MVRAPAPETCLEALFTSAALVALAEIGDKTQLLSLALTTRYRRPWPILAGILAATLLNHALASSAGVSVASALGPVALRSVLALSFFAMAVWVLVPDELDDARVRPGRLGVFGATLVAFFIAEMGDKTQLATVVLAAKYSAFSTVVIGTTAGMLLANAPVVLLGDRIAGRMPAGIVRRAAAALFAALGVLALLAATSG